MNVKKIRGDFPALGTQKNGMPLVYLDNACMSLKSRCVIDAVLRYYEEYSACAGRSVHSLSRRVSDEVEGAREKIASFFGCHDSREFVFTKNTTEGINLVAYSLGLKRGDVVLTTDKEHNSNLVPWQMLARRAGIVHRVVPSRADNTFDIEAFKRMMEEGVSLVSMVHTSNLDGVSIPAREVIEIAHDHGALVLLDGAQSAPHMPLDLERLDVDFFACSVHKMTGPTGVGCLYGKYELLKRMHPFITGGDTVSTSTYTSATFLEPPHKFEGGLQHYAGIIGAGAAVDYLKEVGMRNIEAHERALNEVLHKGLSNIPGCTIIGPENPALRGGITSFVLELSHGDAHDVALVLDETKNIAIRSGAFCVHSWFAARGVPPALRASVYLYNTVDECNRLVDAVRDVVELMRS
ncbi:aminotransferase class V-fold PLP-dependent enzyme [Methermicoccus shengliensis]|uniref:cysteine desulfurase n=1 Tax=Methermicoccus shengliensis TaxID=660064 RepID=A0A832VN88_9EURY|nr:aminotransferase class V-fold PLP-dependent enzyme [Methermicoccus shengliensis]KUK04165.1 MAG: selenocysteine lyase [Euryarchaeota archaeon 55_53]KUK29910.1 MAG: selenocysteine lyase [Methanosarcinales archeaon 56_1174]MDI3488354.1 cysteine desulfurase / selenocysteine lyase [Methanosarcinales archaeon]MDN5295829.1 cysteine desulfurase / selenocysteine lyase [Methanosarcinales archaeon]HIH70066.1 aminotransferase class V-fold PLP-dependent enzyme [Methermicoccus shengliensis]